MGCGWKHLRCLFCVAMGLFGLWARIVGGHAAGLHPFHLKARLSPLKLGFLAKLCKGSFTASVVPGLGTFTAGHQNLSSPELTSTLMY